MRGDKDAIDSRREDYALGIAQFEQREAQKQQEADLVESAELSVPDGPGPDEYNYAAAKRDGVDLKAGYLPFKYAQPGAVTIAGRDLATGRKLVDPSGGYFERFEQMREAEPGPGVSLPEPNAPTRVVVNSLLRFIAGSGQLGEDVGESFDPQAPGWKSQGMRELGELLGKFKGVEAFELQTPEDVEELPALFEDIASDIGAFLFGWQAAPFKLASGSKVTREVVQGAQAAQVLGAEDTIGSALAEYGLLPDVLWFLNAEGLRENDEIFLSRLAQGIEEGALTGAIAAGIYGVVRTARRIRHAEGDSLIERGLATIFDTGGSTPRSRQRGSLDVSAVAPEPEQPGGAGVAAEAGKEVATEAVARGEPSAGQVDGERGAQAGLVDIAEGLMLKGHSQESIQATLVEDGYFPPGDVTEAIADATTRITQRAEEAPGSATGPQQVERLKTVPTNDKSPSARSSYAVEVEKVRPIGPTPAEVDLTRIPPEADATTVSELSGAGLLPEGQPVTFQGKDIPDWTPEDWQGFGQQHGVERLGPLTEQVEVAPGVSLPGGVDGEFTYVDMLWLKAQGYNPNEWPMELRAALQKKLSRSVAPEPGDHVETFNRFVFGMLSPNQPLTPNEFEYARVRAPSMEAIQEWANMVDWEAGADVPIDVRRARTAEISEQFGLQARGAGGLGLRGSSVITDVAEFAQLFLKDPEFFTKQPDESWHQFTEKVMSQARGLSAKVASFSVVWQDPLEAGISAIDRHMAASFKDTLLADPTEREAFEKLVVQRWNSRVGKVDAQVGAAQKELERIQGGKNMTEDQQAQLIRQQQGKLAELEKLRGAQPAESIDDVMSQTGGSSVMADTLMGYVTRSPKAKLRTAKGELNPRVPEHLAEANWVAEPDKVAMIGEVYRRALAANDALAQQQGLHLFSSQWMLWDGIRGRLEPHEVLFPGLYKLPKPSREQLQAALDEHRASGFLGSAKRESATEVDPLTGAPAKEMVPIRETGPWEKSGGMEWWRGAYFSLLPMLGAGVAATREDEGGV